MHNVACNAGTFITCRYRVCNTHDVTCDTGTFITWRYRVCNMHDVTCGVGTFITWRCIVCNMPDVTYATLVYSLLDATSLLRVSSERYCEFVKGCVYFIKYKGNLKYIYAYTSFLWTLDNTRLHNGPTFHPNSGLWSLLRINYRIYILNNIHIEYWNTE